MKNKTKISLIALSAIIPTVAIPTILATSCSKPNEDNNQVVNQYDYFKNTTMLLSPKGESIVRWRGEGKTPIRLQDGRYLSFQDENRSSPTYKAWYILLRDTFGDDNPANDEIFASFCGWNKEYLSNRHQHNSTIPLQMNMPSEISLPNYIELNGIQQRTFKIKALGIPRKNQDVITLEKKFIMQEKFYEYLFWDEQLDFNGDAYFPNLEKIDLSKTEIKYIYEYGIYGSQMYDKHKFEHSEYIFPKSLIYLEGNGIDIYTLSGKLDFSKTKLVEIVIFPSSVNSEIILPPTCKTIRKILPNKYNSLPSTLKINLENVLFYYDVALSGWIFPENIVKINKSAKFLDFFNGTISSYAKPFDENVKIEYFY